MKHQDIKVGDKLFTDGLGLPGHVKPVQRIIVKSVGPEVHKNIQGTEYVWVGARYLSGKHESYRNIWPSNRLRK